MKKICKELQRRLVDDGPRSLRDDEAAQQHLIECDGCFELLESMAGLETSLAELEVVDAPDAWVDELLASPEVVTGRSSSEASAAVSGPSVWSERWRRLSVAPSRRPLIWGSVAAAALVIIVIGLATRGAFRPNYSDALSRSDSSGAEGYSGYSNVEVGQTSVPADEPEEQREDPVAREELHYETEPVLDVIAKGKLKAKPGRQAAGSMPGESLALPGDDLDGAGLAGSAVVGGERRAFEAKAPSSVSESLVREEADEELHRARRSQLRPNALPLNAPASVDAQFAQGEQSKAENELKEAEQMISRESAEGTELDLAKKADKNAALDDDRARDELGAFAKDNKRLHADGYSRWQDEAAFVERLEGLRSYDARTGGKYRELGAGDLGADEFAPDKEVFSRPTVAAAARAFLDERARVTDLVFQDASGYWANTYVPGDPALRLLRMRLERRGSIFVDPTVALEPHDAARQPRQPFDPPESAALALYLNADRRAVAGPQRMLVQVGLKGTERRGGRRPAMNVGVVLDLRGEVPPEVGAGVRALVAAFNEARDRSDRFSLVVAGRGDDVVVEPRSFRHGPLVLALERHLDGSLPSDTLGLDLPSAVRRAVDLVTAAEDPGAPLGTSAVIVVTGQALGGSTALLTDLAHQAAVAGVPVSVIGVGDGVDLAELDRLVLAGQGSRRLLDSAAGAEALVERELMAVSRIVARAVRLRIRLAKGVRLVEVIGSHRLDEAGAQRVREAEQAIDQRIARDLGIVADRGEDEEGIQIVIPGFYAGDEHVLLLDVVVQEPASSSVPIADATVRFKDLVYPGNGVARANLSLERGERVAGPLERNVLKNFLAFRLYEVLEAAGEAVGAGDPVLAEQLVVSFHTLLAELSVTVPGLERDVEIAADMSLLTGYLELLRTGAGEGPDELEALSDSMRYAARLKILPRPLLGDGSG